MSVTAGNLSCVRISVRSEPRPLMRLSTVRDLGLLTSLMRSAGLIGVPPEPVDVTDGDPALVGGTQSADEGAQEHDRNARVRVEEVAEVLTGENETLDRLERDVAGGARTAIPIDRLELAQKVARPQHRENDLVAVGGCRASP